MLAFFGIPQPNATFKSDRHAPAPNRYASPPPPRRGILKNREEVREHHKAREADMKRYKSSKKHEDYYDDEDGEHWSKEEDGMICFLKESSIWYI